MQINIERPLNFRFYFQFMTFEKHKILDSIEKTSQLNFILPFLFFKFRIEYKENGNQQFNYYKS